MKQNAHRHILTRLALSLIALMVPPLIWGSVVRAQQFDENAYKELVDASSPDTIPPGTRITLENWTKYKRFMPTWMQIAFSGKMHFHIGAGADYTMEVAPTGNYPLPKHMREDTEKYAGQTKLVPNPSTGGFGWVGFQAGTPFPNPVEPDRRPR
jgi:hypothetical protein